MSEFDKMLDTLKQSVMSIKNAEDVDNKALLKTSFDQFGAVARDFIQNIVKGAFEQGRRVDLLKHDGVGNSPTKSMDHVAGFALVLKQLEFFLVSWVGEIKDAADKTQVQTQGGASPPEPPAGLVAAAQFYQIGQLVLKFLVDHAADTGNDANSADKDAGPGRNRKNPGETASPDQSDDETGSPLMAKFAAIETRLNRIAAEKDTALAKADAANAALRAELHALRRSTPAPARGALMAVGKAADGALHKGDGEADLRREAERLSKLSDADRALELIKVAQANHLGIHHQF